MITIKPEPGPDGGISAPIFTCDRCGDEITDCAKANMLWLHEEPNLQYHVHKECDRPFEDWLAKSRGKDWLLFSWMSLDQFLDYIAHNSGLSNALNARKARDVLVASVRRKARMHPRIDPNDELIRRAIQSSKRPSPKRALNPDEAAKIFKDL